MLEMLNSAIIKSMFFSYRQMTALDLLQNSQIHVTVMIVTKFDILFLYTIH